LKKTAFSSLKKREARRLQLPSTLAEFTLVRFSREASETPA